MSVRRLPCPGCGAELPLESSTTHAECRHCGRRVWIEESLQRARADADMAQNLALEADRAIDGAVEKELVLDARTRAAWLGVLVAAPGGVLAVAETYGADWLDDRLVVAIQALIVLDSGLGFVAGAAAWLWLTSRARIQKLKERRLSELRGQTSDRARGGRCPSCGAGVTAPAPVASFPCQYCRAPLVLAHGILIPWIADVRQRAKRFQDTAFETLLEAEVWPARTWLAWSLALILLSIALHAALDLLGALLRGF